MKPKTNKTKKTSEKRVKIPLDVQLKLWVLSAGRCEFPGCNKSLLKDGLTLKEDKYGHIAHIIADSENGPRGHATLSKELCSDFSNLMLLCTTHHRLIDGKNKGDYSVELLRLYKIRHEERIRVQTEIQDDHTTTVLRFMSKIGTQPIAIPIAQAYKAIYPNYPADEKGIVIDLTNITLDHDKSYWELTAKQINSEVEKHFSVGNNDRKVNHVSVFALGSIPLLIQLGYAIGNIVPMDIYQRHRDTQDWIWKSSARENFSYKIKHSGNKDAKDVSLVLSLSGKILESEIEHTVDSNFSKYEIYIDNPRVDFLQASAQLEQFREVYRKLITEIREAHGQDSRIHLFPAIPAPIAVLIGKELLRRIDPEIIVYQKDSTDGKFKSALTIK
jgi:hypothetical protein